MLRRNCVGLYQAFTLINKVKAKHKSEMLSVVLSSHCNKSNFPTSTTTSKLHTSSSAMKYKKESAGQDDSDDDDDDGKEFRDERDSKVVKIKVNSLRADLLVKAGLGMARNKVETAFYESKVRVNGKKIPKKSVQLDVGDEIDVIRGFSQANPAHLVVSRVVVLDANDREDGTISVHLRRYKSFLIENYSGADVYKSSEQVDHQL